MPGYASRPGGVERHPGRHPAPQRHDLCRLLRSAGRRDLPADTSTRRTLRSNPGSTNHPSGLGGFLGDNWDSERDEDWYRIDLTQGYVYTVELWTDETYPVRRQATQLKIIGFYDNSGAEISGASSASSGKRDTATYRSESTGRYHIAVGSEGSDDSGVYSIRVIARQQEETAEQLQDTTTIDPPDTPPSDDEEDEDQEAVVEDPPQNTPAGGYPIISGALWVGETLVVITALMTDTDGLSNATFEYQWMANGSAITGATGSSHTLTDGETGKGISVRVTFTDDAGNQESLTSKQTETVGPV